MNIQFVNLTRVALLLSFLINGVTLASISTASSDSVAPVFAVVNGEDVTVGQYVEAFQRGLRTRFYHGKPPEVELLAYRKEVGMNLIDAVLLEQESARLGLQVDSEWVDSRYQRRVEQLRKDPRWEYDADTIKQSIRAYYVRENLLDQVIERIQQVPTPDEQQIEVYYKANPDKFSTPGQIHAQVILVKVPPAATVDVWQAAQTKVLSLVERINKGEDFAELAKAHSDDPSAGNGGDLGYIHGGMLGDSAQRVLDQMRPGEVSGAVQLLDGFATLQLVDRKQPQLNPLSEVRERAVQLWHRKEQQAVLDRRLDELRRQARVEVRNTEYLALPEVPDLLAKYGWSSGGNVDG